MDLLSNFQLKERIQFPETRDVLIAMLEKIPVSGLTKGNNTEKLIEYCFRKIEVVRDAITDYHPSKIGNILSDVHMKLEASDDSLEFITKELEERWKAPNEFFTIFDMSVGREVCIDKRMHVLMGLDPDTFYSSTEEALDPEKTIYYRDDLFHAMRFAMMCYLVMTMPGFTWQSQRDHYMVRLRLSTRNSRHEEIRRLPYVTVEKRCYFGFDNSNGQICVPQYHFDRYTVYPDLEMDYVFRTIVSEEKQSVYMNAFAYMFNLHLIGIPPKYILMLDERQVHDRNKTVALALADNIRKYAQREVHMDEHKIADCFAKTIRHRVEEAYNAWDRRPADNRVRIDSDTSAVHYAKKLGLLPVPSKIRELMFSMVG